MVKTITRWLNPWAFPMNPRKQTAAVGLILSQIPAHHTGDENTGRLARLLPSFNTSAARGSVFLLNRMQMVPSQQIVAIHCMYIDICIYTVSKYCIIYITNIYIYISRVLSRVGQTSKLKRLVEWHENTPQSILEPACTRALGLAG